MMLMYFFSSVVNTDMETAVVNVRYADKEQARQWVFHFLCLAGTESDGETHPCELVAASSCAAT